MESLDITIRRHAIEAGMSFNQADEFAKELVNCGVSFSEAAKAIYDWKEIASTVKKLSVKKRRKPTNYTKPRSRKKKSKY